MLDATCDDLVAKAASIDLVRIDEELDTRGFIIIRDPDLTATADAARAEYDRDLHALPLHAPRENFHYSALLDRPWRKAAIGSGNGVGDPYAQNLQTIYFSAGDAHYPALGRLFRFMLAVRNRLMRVDPSFGDNPERDRFWNACRIHQYPRGGGFMVMHKDTHFPPIITSELGKPFCQVSVLLSRKNVDFFKGGGVVVDRAGNKIDLESEGGFGSLVLFDGRTFHGVEDVDLDQVIDFSRPDGRLAAFVSLYTVR